MRRILLISFVVVAVAIGYVLLFNKKDNKGGDKIISEPQSETYQYKNEKYKFSLTLPKEIYSSECNESNPVGIDEKDGVVSIGTRFACDAVDNDYFFGWNLYASNNVVTENDAQNYIQKYLGSSCTVSEWDGNKFFVSHVKGEKATIEEVSNGCPFLMNKYRVQYSPELKTAVMWNLGGNYMFSAKDGSFYDEDMLASFAFSR